MHIVTNNVPVYFDSRRH